MHIYIYMYYIHIHIITYTLPCICSWILERFLERFLVLERLVERSKSHGVCLLPSVARPCLHLVMVKIKLP